MKNLSSWLKGGIIGVILNILLLGTDYILFGTDFFSYSRGDLCDIACPFTIASFLVTEFYWGSNTFASVWIFSSLIFFIIFAVIGWIYGKIKNRKYVK